MTKEKEFSKEYLEYINGPEWRERKRLYYLNHSRKCFACGVTDEVQLHHITYKRMAKEIDADLMPLCLKHHKAVDTFKTSDKINTERATKLMLADYRKKPVKKKKKGKKKPLTWEQKVKRAKVVGCILCGVLPGERCIDKDGKPLKNQYHSNRMGSNKPLRENLPSRIGTPKKTTKEEAKTVSCRRCSAAVGDDCVNTRKKAMTQTCHAERFKEFSRKEIPAPAGYKRFSLDHADMPERKTNNGL